MEHAVVVDKYLAGAAKKNPLINGYIYIYLKVILTNLIACFNVLKLLILV